MAVALLTMLLLTVSCSVKRDVYLTATDTPPPQLPATAVEQRPAYYVPPPTAAEQQLSFVNRPRPLPELIAPPPVGIEPTLSRSRDLRIYQLAYNSNDEPSLLITPSTQDDKDSLLAELSNRGFTPQELDPDLAKLSTAINQYGNEDQLLNLYHYADGIMLSLVAKGNDFAFLVNLRESFLAQ